MEELFGSFSNLSAAGIAATVWNYIVVFVNATWWFWGFFIVFRFAQSAWLYWRQRVFEEAMEWVFLEIKIPREILKGPRSMDQLFQAVAALRNAAGDLGEKYLDGEVTRWYAFEMCSFGGEIHFYVRVVKEQRPLMEAAFFSYYPDVEIEEIPDYTHHLPHNITDLRIQGLKMWSTELVLAKEPAYPIKSYLAFEDPDEMNQFDPISVFMENLGKAKKGEFVGVQYCIAPEARDWGDAYKHTVEELREPKFSKKPQATPPGQDIPVALKSALLQKSPGQTEVLRAVEANLAKPGFKCIIRILYISPRNIFFDPYARRGIIGSFNQYAAADLNSFFDNKKMTTKIRFWHPPFVFPILRNEMRKQRLLHSYHEREFGIETFIGKVLTSHVLNWNFHSKEIILNSESLASLYHPPTSLVLTAPHTRRVESKKMGAPAGLPIYADDEILENFK
jgi:hypothetical protein